jgi:dolichol-phosphate mannosyltransferase
MTIHAPDTVTRDELRSSRNVLLSIVLPVFNEVDILERLHARVSHAVRRAAMPFEIIYVDDGSSDGSSAQLDELVRRDSHVTVVHLSRNFGHQAAIQAGLCEARGDAVILMDSDLQDEPEAIQRFVEQWRAGFDVVYAIRADRKEALPKRLLFGGFYRLLSAIATTPLPLDAGIFGLMDRRVVAELLGLPERDRYLPGLRSWVGFRQTGIVVERHARYDDSPRVSLLGLFRLAKTAIFSFSTFPLTVFYVIGLSALTIFAGLATFSLFCKLFTNLAIPGWTSHILSASFFGALNALGVSILGEYVIRIYDQVRARPMCLVARRVTRETPQMATPAPLSLELPDAEEQQLLDEAQALLAAFERNFRLHSADPVEREPATQTSDVVAGRTTIVEQEVDFLRAD